jgi:ABC-type sugar transport system ATPase subunit
MPPVVAVHGIAKAYPGVVALNDVNLTFHQGQITGLMGKNGAGKSTLIKIIAGLEIPHLGQIQIDGRPVQLSGPRDAFLHGLAFVHQELSDVPKLSVAENVLLGQGYPKGRYGLIRRKTLASFARNALARVGLDVDPLKGLSSLTVAERRLVMIARALARNARFLVLDEPTASLTQVEIDRLHGVLRGLTSEGVSILYVTHRMQEVEALCDRVVVMRDGRVVSDKLTVETNLAQTIIAIAGQTPEVVRRGPDMAAVFGDVRLSVTGMVTTPGKPAFDFSVRSGEIVGLAGLAGSGRTETLKQIAGATPSKATISLNGRRLCLLSPADAIRSGIVMLAEDRRREGAIFSFSTGQNITLSSTGASRILRGLPLLSPRKDLARGARCIREIGIKADGPDTPIKVLSGGNQQKAILARCLETSPSLLLLDEPTHGVDVAAKQEIYDIIRKLASGGTSVILVSSDLPELVELCDRSLVLRQGQLIAALPRAELSEKSVLDLCFGT